MKKAAKLTEEEQVQQYMQALDYPLRQEVETLRTIIKAQPGIAERIKWNAPSYYTHTDLVTFNLHDKKSIRLVFHHPEIVNITSPLLKGDWKDRRLAYFNSMEDIITHQHELEKVIAELVKRTAQT